MTDTAGKKIAKTAAKQAIRAFVGQGNTPYDFGKGKNATANVENLIHDNLFPKIKEQDIVDITLQNKFSPFVRTIQANGEIIEEYVAYDNLPVELGLEKDEAIMLKRKYPDLAVNLYSNQIAKKSKLTFDLKEVRKRVSSSTAGMVDYLGTLIDGVYNGIKNTEQQEWLEAFLAYYRMHNLEYKQATTMDDLGTAIVEGMYNLQDNSTLFNQGGAAGLSLTTSSNLEDLYIITTDNVAAHLTNKDFPQKFNAMGIDFRDRLISVSSFGSIYTTNADYTLVQADIDKLRKINYMLQVGDVIKSGSVIPKAWVSTGFDAGGAIQEYKFDNDKFGFIIDRRAIKYLIDEGAGWVKEFQNGEYLQTNNWFHYTTCKAISPFHNKLTFGVGAAPTK